MSRLQSDKTFMGETYNMKSQKDMQKLDILDFLMGIKSSKKFPELIEFGATLRDLITYTALIKGDYNIDFPPNHVNAANMNSIRSLLQHDKVMTGFYKSFYHYNKSSDTNNYIISKPLASALSLTKTDIKCSYIPKDINGYMEIPELYDADGEQILGIFFHTGVQDQDRELTIGYMVLDKLRGTATPCMLNVFFKDTDLLKDVISKFPYTEINYSKPTVEHSAVLTNFMATIINALIYIHNTNEELVEEVNYFTGSKKAQQRQGAIYTPQPYTLVGRNFRMPRAEASEHMVSGHFKWVRYGAEHSLIRHQYVEPYPRGKKSI